MDGCDIVVVRSCMELEPEWLCLLENLHRKLILLVGQLPITVYDDTGNKTADMWLWMKVVGHTSQRFGSVRSIWEQGKAYSRGTHQDSSRVGTVQGTLFLGTKNSMWDSWYWVDWVAKGVRGVNKRTRGGLYELGTSAQDFSSWLYGWLLDSLRVELRGGGTSVWETSRNLDLLCGPRN